MTLKQTAKCLYKLSIGGYFNHEKFTFEQFDGYVESLFKGDLKLGNAAVIEIALPDGWWLCKIIKYTNQPDGSHDGFDYDIPETRAEESKIWAELMQ